VAFYVLVLFFLREFLMREVLRPLAHFLRIKSRSKRGRFNEQMYVAVYTGIVGPLGVYVYFHMTRTMMYHSHPPSVSAGASAARHSSFPFSFFSTADMYEGYPHKTHPAGMKFYYLLQAAFWVQQALVMILGLETRRRDFRELVLHHVVTVALIALSYRFHFTVMGVLVYVTHDISDFFLAVSLFLFLFFSNCILDTCF
jgi:very-long-chain ceramide synthase